MTTPLATDLYQLTMMAGYQQAGITGRSTFELFVRHLPPRARVPRRGGDRAGARSARGPAVHARRDPLPAHGARARVGARRILRRPAAGVPLHGRRLGRGRGRGGVRAGADPARDGAGARGAARRDGAARDHHVPDQHRQQGRAHRARRARAGPSIEFGSRRAHGLDAALHAARAAYLAGLRRDVERRGRLPLRHPGLRHDGALVGDVVRATRSTRSGSTSRCSATGRRCSSTPTTRSRPPGRSSRPVCGRRACGSTAATWWRSAARSGACSMRAGSRRRASSSSGDLDEHRIAQLLADGAPIDAFGVGTALSTSRRAGARRRLQAGGDRARRRHGAGR